MVCLRGIRGGVVVEVVVEVVVLVLVLVGVCAACRRIGTIPDCNLGPAG
jgi:hypothetical protein